MYPQTQQLATNLLVELQNETREVPCEVLQENCRLGLGKFLKDIRAVLVLNSQTFQHFSATLHPSVPNTFEFSQLTVVAFEAF